MQRLWHFLTVGLIKRHGANEWIFSKTEIFWRKTEKNWLIYWWKTDLANLKSDVDKLAIDKFKNVPSNLSSLKSKADKLAVDKLIPVPVYLSRSKCSKMILLK